LLIPQAKLDNFQKFCKCRGNPYLTSHGKKLSTLKSKRLTGDLSHECAPTRTSSLKASRSTSRATQKRIKMIRLSPDQVMNHFPAIQASICSMKMTGTKRSKAPSSADAQTHSNLYYRLMTSSRILTIKFVCSCLYGPRLGCRRVAARFLLSTHRSFSLQGTILRSHLKSTFLLPSLWLMGASSSRPLKRLGVSSHAYSSKAREMIFTE
jgi:hypothetical protein